MTGDGKRDDDEAAAAATDAALYAGPRRVQSSLRMHRREALLGGEDDQSEERVEGRLRPLDVQPGEMGDVTLAAVAAVELAFVAAFVVGVVLNTLLLVVYCRRRGFRSQISNRYAKAKENVLPPSRLYSRTEKSCQTCLFISGSC